MRTLQTVAVAAFFLIGLPGVMVWAMQTFLPYEHDYLFTGSGGPQADSVVKLQRERGHGSAVHIGNGLYLTAAHVTRGAESLTVKTSLGDEITAEVLWESPLYDIALIRTETPNAATATLDCRALEVGEALSLKGNPLNLEFQTTWGRVSGGDVTLGPWRTATPVDASLAGGMSGGAVFDADGDLVGINVGGMVQQMGMGGSFVGISYVVPANAICGLLGRTESYG